MNQTKTNPPGEWVFQAMELRFINKSILALYGKVCRLAIDENKLTWYWEARTALNARAGGLDMIPCGYAPTKESAQRIVEILLYETGTVEKGE